MCTLALVETNKQMADTNKAPIGSKGHYHFGVWYRQGPTCVTPSADLKQDSHGVQQGSKAENQYHQGKTLNHWDRDSGL